MVLVADVLYIGGIVPVYYGFLPVICSWSFVHQSCSICRVVDIHVCYVLFVIQMLRMNGFFLCYGFFLCVMVYTVQ